MRPVRPADDFMIVAESDDAPMHIGSLQFYDVPAAERPAPPPETQTSVLPGAVDAAGETSAASVANNAAPANSDVLGAFTSLGYNLVQTRGTSTGYVATDLANGANPSLAPLQFAPVRSTSVRSAPSRARCSSCSSRRSAARPRCHERRVFR